MLFLGASGAGKSTLAAFLDGRPCASGIWRRAGDDVLPVAQKGGRWAVRPRFPQLKLTLAEERRRATPDAATLARTYALVPPREDGSVVVQRLPPARAALRLVEQTVAARLFAGELLHRHLDHAARIAAAAGVRELSYPRRRDRLPQVAAALERDLASG